MSPSSTGPAGRALVVRPLIKFDIGKGQHIGRLITIAVAAVQASNLLIISQEKADFALFQPRDLRSLLERGSDNANATLVEIIDDPPPLFRGHGQHRGR